MVAVGVGAARASGSARGAWSLVLLSQLVWALAGPLWTYHALHQPTPAYPSGWLSSALLAQSALLPLGLSLLTARRNVRTDAVGSAGRALRAALLDTAALTAGVGTAAWTFLAAPLAHRPAPWVAVGLVLLGLLLLASALGALLIAGTGNGSLLTLAAAALTTAGGGAVYLTTLVHGIAMDSRIGVIALLGWAAGAVLAGVAALHPAAGERPEPGPAESEAGLPWPRLAAFVLLALTAPALAGRAAAGPPGVPIVLATAAGVLVVGRLALVARLAEVRGTQLNQASAVVRHHAEALNHATRDREMLRQDLRRVATHDPLTGLGNRTLLNERLADLIASRDRVPVCLLLLDLDGFKAVNDTLGHPAGDELLVEVAYRLKHALPAADLLVRLGGDEFAAVLRPADEQVAVLAAEAVLAAVRPPYRVAGREGHLTASVGVLPLTDQNTASDVLRDADLALYAAKDAGRNQINVFRAGLRDARVRHGDLTSGLRRAVEAEELVMHYQPVVDLTDGHIVAVEALLRWQPEVGPAVSPVQFVPVAEETGLIVPIGGWVLEQACRDAKKWYETYGVTLTVNVSGHQLREPLFVELVLHTLDVTGLPPEALVLELTETTLITSAGSEISEQLQRLRNRGVGVALDNFGTGYSSLSYLMQLPVDILKIDRSFSQLPDEGTGPRTAFIRAVLDLAESLELRMIAEGVETPEQARLLRTVRCPLGQGFLYSHPVAADRVDTLLTNWNSGREVTAARHRA